MITLFVYDISNDRIRTKISQICLDYGLKRIQYSAFLGDLSLNRQEELWLKCRRRLGGGVGNLQLFVLTPQDLARSRKYVKAGEVEAGIALPAGSGSESPQLGSGRAGSAMPRSGEKRKVKIQGGSGEVVE